MCKTVINAGISMFIIIIIIIIILTRWVGYGERRHAELPREDVPSRLQLSVVISSIRPERQIASQSQ
jgi:hypothetical protein